MRKQPMWHVLKLALVAVALVTTAMALYVQLFERRSLEEEDRLMASRLTRALEESRAHLKAEILEELETAESPAQKTDQPRPGAVLRRSESARDRALQQALSPESAEAAAIARLEQRVDAIARQADQTDRVLHRDLEEIRAETRRDRNVTGKILSLLITALTSLGLHAVMGLVEERTARPQE